MLAVFAGLGLMAIPGVDRYGCRWLGLDRSWAQWFEQWRGAAGGIIEPYWVRAFLKLTLTRGAAEGVRRGGSVTPGNDRPRGRHRYSASWYSDRWSVAVPTKQKVTGPLSDENLPPYTSHRRN